MKAMFSAQSLSALAPILATDTNPSPVWHYWLAVPIALGGVVAVVSVVALYVSKVTRTRFPKGEG